MANLAGRRIPPIRLIDLIAGALALTGFGLLIDGTVAGEIGRVQAVWVITLLVAAATAAIWSHQHRLYEQLQMRYLEMLCNQGSVPKQGSMNGSVHHLNRVP